jgi:hypothetical protein
MKWCKRACLVVALLLFGAILFSAGGLILLRGTPDFYRPMAGSVEERDAAAQRAQDKLATINNYAVEAYGSAIRTNNGTEVPVDPPAPASIDVSFTERELNALFSNWSKLNNWKQTYEQYLTDPVLIFRENRIILAGKAKVNEINAVVSVHFQPQLTEEGELDLHLVRVQGGRLPLPQAMLQKYVDHARQALQNRLPHWQRNARLDANGAANGYMIAAAMGKLALQTLDHEPAAPVAFLPMVMQDVTVPVKITDVKVEDKTLTLTAELYGPSERAALLDSIREPYSTETAMMGDE